MLLLKEKKDEVYECFYSSSNILKSIYDGKDLTIIFKNGGRYMYPSVSKLDYNEFETCESQGKFLNSNIKRKYEAVKLENVDISLINEEYNLLNNEAFSNTLNECVSQMKEIIELSETKYSKNDLMFMVNNLKHTLNSLSIL